MLLIIDALIYNLALICTFALRFKGTLPAENFDVYRELWPWFTLITLICMYIFGLFDRNRKPDYIALSFDIFKSQLMSTVLLVMTAFFARSFAMPRLVILLSVIMTTIFLSLWRSLRLNRLLKHKYPQKIIVIGDKSASAEIVSEFKTHGHGLWSASEMNDYGEFLDFNEDEMEHISAVIVTSDIGAEAILRLIFACENSNVRVLLIPGLYELFLGQGQISVMAGIPVVEIVSRIPEWRLTFKRVMDIAIALPALAVFTLFLPLIALIIKADSKGTVFFSQKRLGLKGSSFTIYKLRTMIADAEAGTGPVLASEGDSRVTRVGRWLRKTRIDEMPQLINVLTGEMSIVGPRPERPELHEEILKKLPSFQMRLRIKPGLTGMAQIYGRYDTSHANKLRYDLAYIQSMSALLDIRLIFETLRVLFTLHGAR